MKLPEGWREIAERVNTDVNALPQVPEKSGDFWKRAGADGGDCEDLALAKLDRLLEAGFPIEALRLATCRVGWTKKGEPHVVLAIDGPDDQWVLCNRFSFLLNHPHLVAAGYHKDAIQKVGGSKEWVKWTP
jgi:predicted transglutaminase-like cysteine proteinase